MLHKLNDIFPVRYTVFGLCVLALLLSLATLPLRGAGGVMLVLLLPLVALGIYDMAQSKRSILRNYPIIGHIRYMLEFVRPELRQYFLESDNEATPFSRAQRSLVYQRAKGESDKRTFGTLLDDANRVVHGLRALGLGAGDCQLPAASASTSSLLPSRLMSIGWALARPTGFTAK